MLSGVLGVEPMNLFDWDVSTKDQWLLLQFATDDENLIFPFWMVKETPVGEMAPSECGHKHLSMIVLTQKFCAAEVDGPVEMATRLLAQLSHDESPTWL